MDEVFYIGEDNCPRCSGRDKAELFAGEVTKIRNHLALKNRRLMIWGDRLIDGKTSVIHTSSTKSSTASDNVHYAKYDGDSKNLVPGYWKSRTSTNSEDIIKDSSREVSALQDLLKARTQIKDYNTLSNEALDECAAAVTNAVLRYLNNN